MSVFVQYIINDQDYIRLYYSNNDCIRNRGSLTLIHLIYVTDFSNILKLLKHCLNEYNDQNDTPISDKDIIKNMMKSKMNIETNNYINNICEKAINEINISLDIGNMDALVWDLIDRVMNSMIGLQVKKYRSDKMARVNDVSFRKRIAVKCKSANI